ncbi:MAG TPA: hypothetical protein VE398_04840 [Acidobacteriota bacterium]|nr:hypothetical protein [Acidobacteriota bacterium]
MYLSQIELTALSVTYAASGTCGYLAGSRVRRPVRALTLVPLIIATAVAGYVGISTRLISVFGFNIYLNWALQAFGLGMLVNLLIRRDALRSQ